MTDHTPDALPNVSVLKRANVYFDGRCVSHTIYELDGSRLTLGVILPSTLSFETGAPEVMELIEGRARVRLHGASDWTEYVGGERFEVPGQSGFEIETLETLHYLCRFG